MALAFRASRAADLRAGGSGEISKAARDEVEQTLRTEIRDDAVVGQLTTAVVRFG
jgi:hypothetical protein